MEHTVATDPKEIKYIKKRCRKAFREKICFHICRIFPIKKNLISICTFEGKGGFGCNAKPLVKRCGLIIIENHLEHVSVRDSITLM